MDFINEINHTAKKTTRIFYFDVLRVIACLAVIMLHASASYVTSSDLDSFNFWIGNFFDSVSRIGVPIFVMISGALMLDENYDFSVKKLLEHIIKIIVFYVFWSAAYSIIDNIVFPIITNRSVNLKSVILAFIYGHYHLWFCFMIIGLYLLVPLLRLWIKKQNKKFIGYFLILAFLFDFLFPQIIRILGYYTNKFNFINEMLNNVNLKYVTGYLPYFILGWYLHNFDFKHKKVIYLLGVFGLCFTFLMTYIFSKTTGMLITEYSNLSINVLLQTTALFITIKSIYDEHITDTTRKFDKSILFISKNSLGVYAIHAGIISLCYTAINKLHLNYAIVNIIGIFLIAFTISLLASFLIRKISFLKKIV